MKLNITYFNCNGFKGVMPFFIKLVNESDILCLQELMLTKREGHILNNCHDDYVGYGVSPVDSSDGIISGRPYGGVGFL